ncbi:MAG TPA: ATPase, T2SS/T4P/T4SS family [Candidatus Limnocylindrales bacterium]|nr:ATPase, T2SS/T4P/T4SS family [Candidatus Limnocylindrales bacterium]
MSLLSRVERSQQAQAGEPAPPPNAIVPAVPVSASNRVQRDELLKDLRVRMQAEVVNAFDAILDAPPEEIRPRIEGVADRVIQANGFAVTRDERLQLVQQLIDEVGGFGPIEPFLADETVTEVMVNGPDHIYIERAGKIQRVDSYFLNDEHVLRIIDRIITPLGRRIDESSPRVDARLPDGSRVNAIIPPLSLIGPVITVRKFAARPFTVEDLIRFGTASPEMFDFLRACIGARLNVFVSGGTGSGKTTTLNVLSSFIPNGERIVTIEDAAELQLRQDHVLTLEARPANLEGEGEITIRDLLRNAMHMRPDRIIVGECRSGEALDMIQAMTTGHDGSLSTGHANSPRDMLRRLETMVLMTGYEMPLRAIREQIASAVDIIVHTARLKDGSRRITNITEVYGIEEDEILTQDVFAFEQTGVLEGKIQGDLRPTGIRPTFMDQFRINGVELPPGEFGIPPVAPPTQRTAKPMKSRWGGDGADTKADLPKGTGKVVTAGGMVYITTVGPVNPETGAVVSQVLKDQVHACLSNLKALLEETGSSLDKIVWANWCLRDQGDFDSFNDEWVKWFPGDAPVGQGTLMPPLQRRAGFRVSIGVIAQQ